MKYSVLLIDDSGKASYLSVRDKTKFCKKTATKHYDGLTAISDSGNMDISVKQFNEFLAQSINNALAKMK